MNKKLFAVFLAVLCVGVLFGAGGVFSASSANDLRTRSLPQILADADDDVSLQSALTAEYSLTDFNRFEAEDALKRPFLMAQSDPVMGFPGMQMYSMLEVNKQFPIEVLRRTPELVQSQPWQQPADCYYTVYRITEGGYLYCFFIGSPNLDESYLIHDRNYLMNFTLYAKETLTAEDFASLGEGSCWEQVRSIALGARLCNDLSFEQKTGYSFSAHLLKNDLLAFVYDEQGKVIARWSCFGEIPQKYKDAYPDCQFIQYPPRWAKNLSALPILPQDMP